MATEFEQLFSAERLPELGKQLNLVQYLPEHLLDGEVEEFMTFFQDFLNEMYYNVAEDRGDNSLFDISAANAEKEYFVMATSGNGEPALTSAGLQRKDSVSKADRISILEKAKRISDLHDPNLMDIEYIQRLATFMGYDIDLSKGQLGTFGTSTEEETNQYLRFIISNLPNWYKIKSTDNAVKVLLYSFGLIGELVERWTSDQLEPPATHPATGGYSDDSDFWITEDISDGLLFVDSIPENYWLTPHFNITINADNSLLGFLNTGHLNEVIDAVETIRPINTVFDGLEILLTTFIEFEMPQIQGYHIVKMVSPLNTSIPIPITDYDFVESGDADDLYVESGDGDELVAEGSIP